MRNQTTRFLGQPHIPALLIILMAACVDRVVFKVGQSDFVSIVAYGSVDDGPGPYQVEISNAFEIDSDARTSSEVSIKEVRIEDNAGNKEKLARVGKGIYATNPISGTIRGCPGRAYKLIIELPSGRIFESKPDTLRTSGTVDSVYFSFFSSVNPQSGKDEYGFDIFFDSSIGDEQNKYFLWKFTGTYQVETHPQFHRVPCDSVAKDCDNAFISCGCREPLPCSGYVKRDTLDFPVSYYPCTCCTCWVNVYNKVPLISDAQFIRNGHFRKILASRIPLTPYNFMFKLRAEIKQLNLSRQSFEFWKGIRDQKLAANSLFQPISGKIPANFIQVAGSPSHIYGIFYAAGASNKHTYIRQSDIPNPNLIPQDAPFKYVNKIDFGSCLDFPHSTNIKPSFWVD